MNRTIPAALVVALALCAGARAHAQTEAPKISPVTTGIDASVLDDLPSDDSIFSILETTEPSLISDRFMGGGTYTGQAPRIGGFFSSWNQTLYRIGDVSISDPTGSGAPLLLPDPGLWRNIQITTGMMPVSVNAAGVAVRLDPARPADKWTTTLAGTAGFPGPASGGAAPTIARSDGWDRASMTASGPLLKDALGATRLGGFVGASWTRGKTVLRSDSGAATATSGSALAHLVFTPNERNAIDTIGWVQKINAPFDQRVPYDALDSSTDTNAAHIQASWSRGAENAPRFRAFGAYTQRQRTRPSLSTGAVFERLVDGPVSQLAFDTPGTVRQWTLGLALPPAAAGSQSFDGGVEIGGSRDRSLPFAIGPAGELVDGTPARLWLFNAPAATTSNRHATTVDAYMSDRISVTSRLLVNAGIRFDGVTGAADGAVGHVSWQTWLPRAGLEWKIADPWQPTLFAGIARSAYRLPLDLLAFGDPGAPTANVFQWLPSSPTSPSLKATGALIARVGPGTGGDAAFSQIDPGLDRPTTDELTIGIETHPSSSFRLGLTGFVRRERHLLTLVDSGAPLTAYTLSGQTDPGLQLQNPADDQLLPVYNRTVASFGQDRYLLTNQAGQDATSKSISITGELKTDRVILFGGLSANQSEAPAANVGFGPLENEPDVIGDLFVDPNAATFARGRIFSDRAYTIKISTVLRLPGAVHAGIVARYQDGQPFSRLVIVPGLNQGAEEIRAFPNGGSRFTFTETLDARVQKRFAIGNDSLDVVLDVFNLLNTQNEVEERTVGDAAFRAVTAIQPPRTVHAGFRVSF